MVAAISAGQWRALVRACRIEDAIARLQAQVGLDFGDEAQRHEGRDAIAALLEPWFAARHYAELARILDEHRVCWGTYRTAGEALAQDPRVSLANPVFESAETVGVGPHMTAGSAVRLANAERMPTHPAPLLGADTDAVLKEVLGLDSGTIGRLHDAGVVAGPERDPTVASG
jgi:2-methylfumaryl-CoA isomerase